MRINVVIETVKDDFTGEATGAIRTLLIGNPDGGNKYVMNIFESHDDQGHNFVARALEDEVAAGNDLSFDIEVPSKAKKVSTKFKKVVDHVLSL